MSSSQYDLESKVLLLLEEFEDKIESLSALPLTGKVVMDREEILDIIREIHMMLPEEYQHVKWLKANNDHIINEAHKKANLLIVDAQNHETQILETAHNEKNRMMAEIDEHAKKMVEDHEIVKRAKIRADEILEEAYFQAQEMKKSAYGYTDELLYKAGEYFDDILRTIDKNREEIHSYQTSIKDK